MTKNFIDNGDNWSSLIPYPQGSVLFSKYGATLTDTLSLIQKVIAEHSHELKQVAPLLRGSTIEETCSRIHQWCYRHFQYKLDVAGTEQIKTPSYSWHIDRFLEKGIDCDDFTIIIGSLLAQLGINGNLCMIKQTTSLDPDKFTHIYVRVPLPVGGYFAIDPVLPVPGQEATDIHQTYELSLLPIMQLQMLGGVAGKNIYSGNAYVGRQHRSRKEGELAKAIANGHLPEGATLEDLEAFQMALQESREKSAQDKYGLSAKELAERQKSQIQEQIRQGQANELAIIERLKSELDKRGVAYPSNSNRDTLIKLLNEFPATSKGLQVANAANKVFPPAVALRNALLLAMRINYLKIAEKVIWGMFPSYHDAKNGGFEFNQATWEIRANAFRKMRTAHIAAGGNPEKLKDAILEGKGNKDDIQLGGDPLTATAAVSAASALLTVVAAILKKEEGSTDLPQAPALDLSTPYSPPSLPDARTPIHPDEKVAGSKEGGEKSLLRKYWWIALSLLATGGGYYYYQKQKQKGDDETLAGLLTEPI